MHYINQLPLIASVSSTSTNAITCELRILVLSSQHEDMLFRVRFEVFNADRQPVTTLHSAPLRVISKADGKKKPTSATRR